MPSQPPEPTEHPEHTGPIERPEPIEVVVGVIGRAHGIRGDVAITLRTDEPERRFAPGTVLTDEATGRRLHVESARWHGERLLVCFDEITDRNAAEAARGMVLLAMVDADELPEEPEEYYDRQLVGLEARVDGQMVGRVTAVVHLAAQDLLAVQTPSGERLVPFVSALVPTVDLAQGFVTIVDVPGLLHDQDADGESEGAASEGAASSRSASDRSADGAPEDARKPRSPEPSPADDSQTSIPRADR